MNADTGTFMEADITMSSPRAKEPSNGIVCQHTSTHGPIRLPETAADDFVREFNRTYAAIGMSAQPIPRDTGATPMNHPGCPIQPRPSE